MKKFFLLVISWLCIAAIPAEAQVGLSLDAGKSVTEDMLRDDVSFLCDSICTGRATGTKGSTEAIFWLGRRMRNCGMLPMNGSYFQSFFSSSARGHNVVGFFPGNSKASPDSYVIVMAHFDNLGVMGGNMYKGADSNASGVASMLGVAQMFNFLRKEGRIFRQNIIFVALDGKQNNMAGSQALWRRISEGRMANPLTGRVIKPQNIKMVVNLDIMGGTEATLHKTRKDYLILLGGGKFNSLLNSENIIFGLGMDLGFTYYGSNGFTDLFLNKVSDQKVFLENKIYSVMFTSGITMQTNKASDSVALLDFGILRNRTRLVFHWMEKVMQQL